MDEYVDGRNDLIFTRRYSRLLFKLENTCTTLTVLAFLQLIS